MLKQKNQIVPLLFRFAVVVELSVHRIDGLENGVYLFVDRSTAFNFAASWAMKSSPVQAVMSSLKNLNKANDSKLPEDCLTYFGETLEAGETFKITSVVGGDPWGTSEAA